MGFLKSMPAFLFLCYEKIKIDSNEIILIWFSGLIRGAISIALSMSFDIHNQKLKNIVIMISLFTTLFLSTISRSIIGLLGYTEVDKNKNISGSDKINEFVVNKIENNSDESTVITIKDELRKNLENRFINPLIYKNEEEIQENFN